MFVEAASFTLAAKVFNGGILCPDASNLGVAAVAAAPPSVCFAVAEIASYSSHIPL